MTEGDKPADLDKPADTDRPLWKLNRDEQRLFWITFVGGLASIVVGAGVIGSAIALARYDLRQEKGGHLVLEVEGTAVFLALFLVGLLLLRLPPMFKFMAPVRANSVPEFMVLSGGVLLAFQLLIWIGLAAGIHFNTCAFSGR